MKKINVEITDLNKIEVTMEGLITHRDIRNVKRAIVVKFRQHDAKRRREMNKPEKAVETVIKTNIEIKEKKDA